MPAYHGCWGYKPSLLYFTGPLLILWMVMLFCSGKCSNSLNCSSLPRNNSNHHNDYQEVLEDTRFCYKPVVNPYKSSKPYCSYLKPLTDVRAHQHSSCVAILIEFEASKIQAGNPQMQAFRLIYNLPIQKIMVNMSLLSDSPISLHASPVASHYR